ncbi:hypothetical protein K1T71_001239 [Dendrolimus kikuchii]|uniref:Uncharacterized protein n=1 Tax=Dendrolimus kikuchii TaxID=765133 RepID=A0ACC1DH33_9NEOP|nr:hypothetical protein K1T71_001239 [Dendrolimus kikuchii]
MATIRLLQTNLNHCAGAQDLLFQVLAQWNIHVAVVAEPYRVPDRDEWVGDLSGTVALVSRSAAGSPSLANIMRGRGYAAATIGECVVVGVYFSPNRALAEFEAFLAELGTLTARILPHPIMVLGDFNAKSSAWGSRVTDARGEALEEWALETGLQVLNRGTALTCVRRQGGSIVDISFASPAVTRRVRNWKVLEDVETLSDHRYIRFDLFTQTTRARARESPVSNHPRWAIKKLNNEAFREALLVQQWTSQANEHPSDELDVDEEAERLRVVVTEVCDAAMPRRGRHRPKGQAGQASDWRAFRSRQYQTHELYACVHVEPAAKRAIHSRRQVSSTSMNYRILYIYGYRVNSHNIYINTLYRYTTQYNGKYRPGRPVLF